MKILLVNNHHYIKGGAEKYYFNLAKLLKSNGHQVAFFSMKDSKNEKTKWSKYFVKNINFEKKQLKNRLRIFLRIFYSIEAKRKMKKILEDFNPEIVHINNIYYYLSPSILSEIKKREIPIVQTIHDYQLINPCINLFHDGKICEITKKKKYYKAIFHKCIENSYIATLVAVVVQYIQSIFRLYEKNIDCFIAPSKFIKKKLIEYGFDKNKITHLPNFIFSDNKNRNNSNPGKYIFYFGALTEIKGIELLINLAKKIPRQKIKIAGRFLRDKYKNKILNQISKDKINNIQILGFAKGRKLEKLIRLSKFVIVPSLWFENQPYSILESYNQGKPVIASKIGGIKEIVINNKTGLLFNHKSINSLLQKTLFLTKNLNLTKQMGINGKKFIVDNFNANNYYIELMKIYNKSK